MTELTVLSLGAGVQSTTLALLSIEGVLPPLDGAIFADTGWEPAAVYAHLDRLAAEFARVGVPLYRVRSGNLRDDAINPEHRYASVPYFVLNPPFDVRVPAEWGDLTTCEECNGQGRNPDDEDEECRLCDGSGEMRPVTAWTTRPAKPSEREGMGRRQCTSEYKLKPITRKLRELLGAEPPEYRRVPKGNHATQWIGFSTDEIHRVNDGERVRYATKAYPLLDLGMDRRACERWLDARGWTTTKSACIGCPYHGNRQWREMRDERPEEFADAVEFDAAIRKGGSRGLPLNGEAFLHRSRVPLLLAPIDRVTSREWGDRQGDLLQLLEEDGDPDGCSPYGCRSGEPAA